LAAGVLLALSVPPFGAWPTAFLGAGLLYWRLRGLRLRARLLAGWVAGLGCFGIGLFWAVSFNWYGAVVLVLVEAVPLALAGALTPPQRGRLVAFVGAATLAEVLRMSWPFGGLPVGGVFLGQAGGPLLGTARLGGPVLLTALVWVGGAALAELVTSGAIRRNGAAPLIARVVPRAGLVTLAGVVLVGVLGAVAPDGGAAMGRLALAAVQGGGQRGFTAAETGQAGDFAAELAASSTLLGAVRRPTLVVWPEDVVALTTALAGSPQAARLSGLARALDATVLAGVTVTEPHQRFLNEIVAWSPAGRIVAVFEKVHRVPFGEYIPWRGFFSHLASLSAVPRDAVPGHGSGLMVTPAGRIGVLVSFEVFFAGRGRAAVRAGAQLLAVPTNTSSYGSEQMPSQEVAADQVQAVAEGRDLVQSAPTGYSTLVDNRGRVLAMTGLSARQVLSGTLALRRGATLYEHLGDLPVVLLAVLALVIGVAEDQRRRRSTRVDTQRDAPGAPAPARTVTNV
jgi:apolipoprotein N-acyltransferase